jgi:aryl carrier-like protein
MFIYYGSDINIRKLYAETKIKQWASLLMEQGGTGRNCSQVNYNDINRILDSIGLMRINDVNGMDIVELPIDSIKHMELVEMNYYAKHSVVAGVYRCEKADMIQELQLAIYLEPRNVPQKSSCYVAKFYKSWNIPTGKATMFSLP